MAKTARRVSDAEIDLLMPEPKEASVGSQADHEAAREDAQAHGQGYVDDHITPVPPLSVGDDKDDETFLYTMSPREMRTTGKRFDPTKKFRTLRGGGGGTYLDAKWRLVWVRSEFPDCTIETELVKLETSGTTKDKIAVFKAIITLPGEQGKSTGYGSETEADFKDYIEKAEKKAISRALDHLGYGTAAAEDDGERIADAPIAPPPKKKATKADPAQGFPPVAWEGQKLVNMPQVRTAMFAALDHENRAVLYKKIKGTEGWENAVAEVKVYWQEANDFDSDMAPQE